jgi:site-specific DNA-methyltransferase (adenine-specific)
MDFKTDNLWLMQGDCLERMKEIPSGSVDIVISDVPYGIDFSHWDVTHNNTNSALLGSSPAQKESQLFKTRGKPLNGWSAADKQRGKEFEHFCIKWLSEIYRVTKPCSPVMIMCGRQMQHRFTCAAENVGFIFKDYITWDKMKAPFRAQKINCVLSKRGVLGVNDNIRLGNLAPVCEPIVWLFKPYLVGTTVTDCFIKDRLGVFDCSVLQSNKLNVSSSVQGKKHETQKPVELMEVLVKLVSSEHHTVLDMFMGSGTTGVACSNLNRKFIGIEKDENYFNIAKNRILEE